MPSPIWIVDTSAIIEIKSFVPRDQRERLFAAFTALITERRLKFPMQVLHELSATSKAIVRIKPADGR